eukprot:GHVT01082860.1.p2 GENE.GHVT01082860.1~~GHVT01082860.1.p2  ORF type:complete len:172 (+),score=37.41 GHVT01082860.1:228-743(+)
MDPFSRPAPTLAGIAAVRGLRAAPTAAQPCAPLARPWGAAPSCNSTPSNPPNASLRALWNAQQCVKEQAEEIASLKNRLEDAERKHQQLIENHNEDIASRSKEVLEARLARTEASVTATEKEAQNLAATKAYNDLTILNWSISFRGWFDALDAIEKYGSSSSVKSERTDGN